MISKDKILLALAFFISSNVFCSDMSDESSDYDIAMSDQEESTEIEEEEFSEEDEEDDDEIEIKIKLSDLKDSNRRFLLNQVLSQYKNHVVVLNIESSDYAGVDVYKNKDLKLKRTYDYSINQYIPSNEYYRPLNINKDIIPSNLKRLKIIGEVEGIGEYFLSECDSIEVLDLSSLPLLYIADNFLSYCINIEKVSLKDLNQLQHIGDQAFLGCENLREVNLEGLIKVDHIGDYFLTNCENIEDIDMSSMLNLKEINNAFLFGCVNIKNIIFHVNNLQKIGQEFFEVGDEKQHHIEITMEEKDIEDMSDEDVIKFLNASINNLKKAVPKKVKSKTNLSWPLINQ